MPYMAKEVKVACLIVHTLYFVAVINISAGYCISFIPHAFTLFTSGSLSQLGTSGEG